MPMIRIVLQNWNSSIINTLQDNSLTIHYNICLDEDYKIPLKRHSLGIMFLFAALWCQFPNEMRRCAESAVVVLWPLITHTCRCI